MCQRDDVFNFDPVRGERGVHMTILFAGGEFDDYLAT